MISKADLLALSPGERRKLAQELAALDRPPPMLSLSLARGRRVGVLVSAVASIVLIGWIVVLSLTLQRSFHAHYWRLAWVGFDVMLLAAFAVTGWAFWRGRQIVIPCLLITATLLLCDAWFDVILDLGTGDMWAAVASALIVELPLAFLMLNAASRLIRWSLLLAMAGSAAGGHPPTLWKIPLLGGRAPLEK